jgi:uncharacterized coiled-coil DUF342 family protein
MGGLSESDYKEKLNKTRESMHRKIKDVRNNFAKIEKMKVEALKKADELRHSADHEIDKMEGEITKSKDLAPESKNRLHSEIDILRREIGEKYTELKARISETMIPA